MQDVDLSHKLSLLGYTSKWLDKGILTENLLDEQVLYYNTGEDPNLEHYRYKTLIGYINKQNELTDQSLAQVLELIEQEQDVSMAASVAIYIMKKKALTEQQFQLVAQTLRKFGPWTEKEIYKQTAVRQSSG